jgi:hypothetical protein
VIEAAIHPIIYVRGYAMTQGEIDDTVADPYMGFNIGSCKVRQLWNGDVKKYFFESPLVRLLKQFRYTDVYHEGADRVADAQQFTTGADPSRRDVPYRSIVIYRYYEPSSDDLGVGLKPSMERFAKGLGDLILALRERIYPEGAATTISEQEKAAGKLAYENFRVYLVAHSMGGLVCRAFLQNPKFASDEVVRLVDKVFTYATPHNGIDITLLGNVPGWLKLYSLSTFNRDEIAESLALGAADRDGESVDMLTRFSPKRVFNLVGTNPADYKVAAGLSSVAAGEASDGLVRIKNATTRGRDRTGKIEASPHAFVHRSHSGYFGIVNSEEGYQNMVRFLYGDVRADGYLEIDEITLPPAVEAERAAKKEVHASYQFEVSISIRNKTWQLHRRTVNENSAIFRKFEDLFPSKDAQSGKWMPNRGQSPMLFNVFLDSAQSQAENTVSFAADLCVRASDYEVDRALFFRDHYDGGYLFRDMITLVAGRTPTADGPGTWSVRYQLASEKKDGWKDADIVDTVEGLTFLIPVVQETAPGIRGRLRVETHYWNDWH